MDLSPSWTSGWCFVLAQPASRPSPLALPIALGETASRQTCRDTQTVCAHGVDRHKTWLARLAPSECRPALPPRTTSSNTSVAPPNSPLESAGPPFAWRRRRRPALSRLCLSRTRMRTRARPASLSKKRDISVGPRGKASMFPPAGTQNVLSYSIYIPHEGPRTPRHAGRPGAWSDAV
jgi:hypothetical protein